LIRIQFSIDPCNKIETFFLVGIPNCMQINFFKIFFKLSIKLYANKFLKNYFWMNFNKYIACHFIHSTYLYEILNMTTCQLMGINIGIQHCDIRIPAPTASATTATPPTTRMRYSLHVQEDQDPLKKFFLPLFWLSSFVDSIVPL